MIDITAFTLGTCKPESPHLIASAAGVGVLSGQGAMVHLNCVSMQSQSGCKATLQCTAYHLHCISTVVFTDTLSYSMLGSKHLHQLIMRPFALGYPAMPWWL